MTLVDSHVYIYWSNIVKPIPKPKIALCFCAAQSWVFWFNTDARYHGHGQMPCAAGCHTAISTDCYLDLSGVKFMSASEIAAASSRGPLSPQFRQQVLDALSVPIRLLSDEKRQLALANL